MDSSHLDPFSATGSRVKQAQDAKDMQAIVVERAKRAGTSVPPYDFLELIGKGSFGRVYKCKNRETRQLVAVKIIDVDELDYKLDNKQKDEAIEDFIKEVNTLKQVKDSNAKNINNILEAFDLHSQLWIVSEYCSGGSVHTLMKSTDGHGLDETYIIPIARELAIALKHVHEAGVIHRDLKCGNVLISEDGRLELCDFGVAAVMETDVSKRSTIIGTPYWMAPEMHGDADEGYGQEIDCWAYGCTVFEMATGMPPYHNFHPSYLRQVLRSVPRLEDDKYSPELKDFVAFCLQERPEDRPKAKQILEHPYIANTEKQYPTASLRNLIDRYVQWERKGGQRMSLFNAMGASVSSLSQQSLKEDNWIFSTTADFDAGYEQRYSQLLHGAGIAAMDFADASSNGANTKTNGHPPSPKKISPLDQAKEEQKASRGEKFLERLFDAEKAPYDYDETTLEDDAQPMSDLPLRNLSDGRAANRETLIDLDTTGLDLPPPTFNFDFGDVPTMKANRKSGIAHASDTEHESFTTHDQTAKRATKDWTFPSFTLNDSDGAKRATREWKFPSFQEDDEDLDQSTKRATRDWKFPEYANTTTATNRRTQDWTFANAMAMPNTADSEPEFSHTSRPSEEEPIRPALLRTVTEPVAKAWDFDHPRQLSYDAAMTQNRESTATIDLDMDTGSGLQTPYFDYQYNDDDMLRPSSAMSAAPSLSSITPFDLEQDPERREEDVRRFSHKREPNSAASSSVAERRLSRMQQLRQSSSGSHLSAPRPRGASVDSTASSLVDEAREESAFGRKYNRSIGMKMRDQLRVGLQRSASQIERHSRHFTDESYGDADTDGPYAAHGAHHRLSRSTGTMSYDTDSSFHDEPRTMVQTPAAFPQLMVPHMAALMEGAGPDRLLEELDKMLEMADQALGFTAAVFRQRENELEGGEMVDSATEGPIEMTSEEERELARFS